MLPVQVRTPVQEEVLTDLRLAAQALKDARASYRLAMLKCAALKIPNTQIARALGLTETAVRTYIKRNRGHGL